MSHTLMYRRRKHGGNLRFQKTTELTKRELEVLELVAAGLTCPKIGRQLYIETETAKTHVAHIRLKLGAKTQAHAVSLGYIRGLLSTTSTAA